MIQIGTNIRRFREIRSYTQGYMAEKIGISQSNYARMENNEIAVSPDRLKKIAEILDTSEERISNFNENMIFNITQGANSASGHSCTVHNYQISTELKKLYDDKILLLEEKLRILEAQNELLRQSQS
jgi:transcriptional regulator with XRE-family HTH domain